MYLSLPGPGNGFEVDPPDNFQVNGKPDPTIGDIISAAIPYIIGIAALSLFIMLIAGGFMFLTAVGDQEKVKKGQGLMVSALIGFVIIFFAFWIMQLLQYILGLSLGF